MKKFLIGGGLAVFAFVLSASLTFAAKPTDKGFDQYGYNKTARIFNGTGMSWCMGKIGNQAYCDANYGTWANDKLIMKWNAEWDRGNSEGWNDPNGYDAWENNEWNGAVPGGSGEVWHYKIKWVGSELQASPLWVEGGYAIWGQFEVIMDQGTAGGEHTWYAHGIPTGYGAN